MGRIVGPVVRRHLAPSWGQLHSGQDQELRDERGERGRWNHTFRHARPQSHHNLMPQNKADLFKLLKHFTGSENKKNIKLDTWTCNWRRKAYVCSYVVLLNKSHLKIRILNDPFVSNDSPISGQNFGFDSESKDFGFIKFSWENRARARQFMQSHRYSVYPNGQQ